MSHNNRTAKNATREAAILAAVPCAACGAPIGQRCREGVAPHDSRRGIEDLRPFLDRTHSERRAEWIAAKVVA